MILELTDSLKNPIFFVHVGVGFLICCTKTMILELRRLTLYFIELIVLTGA